MALDISEWNHFLSAVSRYSVSSSSLCNSWRVCFWSKSINFLLLLLRLILTELWPEEGLRPAAAADMSDAHLTFYVKCSLAEKWASSRKSIQVASPHHMLYFLLPYRLGPVHRRCHDDDVGAATSLFSFGIPHKSRGMSVSSPLGHFWQKQILSNVRKY